MVRAVDAVDPPLSQDHALRDGYGPFMDMWLEVGRFSLEDVRALADIEAQSLNELEVDGPFDAVWEAELFQMLVEAVPEDEDLHEAGPGTWSALAALTDVGAVAVRGDNDGVLDEPPAAGMPRVLFFAATTPLEKIERCATACGLTVEQVKGALLCVTGSSLSTFPQFARSLSGVI